jgi:predicted PurR-regulated permease PerM
MAQRYNPPKQSIAGQIIDVIFLLALVFLALFVPLWLKIAVPSRVEKLPQGVSYTTAADGTKTWTGLSWQVLGQNETMQKQWQAVGWTMEQAADPITQPFDYTIDYVGIIITGLVILGYFVFMLRVSGKEYRQVIAEKFD